MATPPQDTTTLPIRGNAAPATPDTTTNPPQDATAVSAEDTKASLPQRDTTATTVQEITPVPTQNAAATMDEANTKATNKGTQGEDATSPSTTKSCVVCGKVAASRCSRCSEGVDLHGARAVTSYCGKACQASHWSVHKADCKSANARKQLYRAGFFIGDVAYMIRRANWGIRIESAENRDHGKIHVVERQAGPQDPVLCNFSVGMLEDSDDAIAVMMHGAGKEILDLAHAIIAQLLKGFTTTVGEVFIKPKLPNRIVITKSGGSPATDPDEHCLLRVALNDGSVFAIDPTGRQYGPGKTVTPWSEYEARMVSHVTEVKAFGQTAEECNRERELFLAGIAINNAPIDRSVRAVCTLLGTSKSLGATDLTPANLLRLASPQYGQKGDAYLMRLMHLVRASARFSALDESIVAGLIAQAHRLHPNGT